MYESYWGLNELPFENTPDPRFFYRTKQYDEGLARMLYVIRRGKGAAMLSGVYGCGKTLLAHALTAELEGDVYNIGMVTNPRLSDTDLLRRIAGSLGADPVPAGKGDTDRLLEKMLVENHADGRRTVVIIDEAHSIQDAEIFEELRLLLNYQTDSAFLLTLLLFGQPELADKVRQSKQFDQRISMRYHLTPLAPEDTEAYVRHRLKTGGARDDIFSDGALAVIHQRSGGIPRRINQIADSALLIASGQKRETVDAETIREAVETMQGKV